MTQLRRIADAFERMPASFTIPSDWRNLHVTVQPFRPPVAGSGGGGGFSGGGSSGAR